MVASGQEAPEEEVATPILGKRANQVRTLTSEEKLEEMQKKIEKLE